MASDVYDISDICAWIKYWSPIAPITAFLGADSDTFKLEPFLNQLNVLIAASLPRGTSQPYMHQLANDSIMLQLIATL